MLEKDDKLELFLIKERIKLNKMIKKDIIK